MKAFICALWLLFATDVAGAQQMCTVSHFIPETGLYPPVFVSPNQDPYRFEAKNLVTDLPLLSSALVRVFFSDYAMSGNTFQICPGPPNAATVYQYILPSGQSHVSMELFAGGGCLPANHSSCSSGFPTEPVAVVLSINYFQNGMLVCDAGYIPVVSPNITDWQGRRMCGTPAWSACGVALVGLTDAVAFTPALSTANYDRCVDMNGSLSVNVADAVILTPYLAYAVQCDTHQPCD